MPPQRSTFDPDRAEEGFGSAFAALAGEPTSEIEPTAIGIAWTSSPVGPLLLGAAHDAVVLLEFSGVDQLPAQLERLRRQFAAPLVHPPDHSRLRALKQQLAEYFAGIRRRFEVPVRYRGSPFQERVWSALLAIPYGETRSYGAIARALGDPKSTRAVGTANGLNPIAIVVPCHRVVNANGELGGYGGGVWRKQFLLDLERGQKRLF